MASPNAKLVVSALITTPDLESALLEALERELGGIDLVSERVPFTHTRYYEPEMGPDLCRRMISFRSLLPADALVEMKLRAQALEDRFRNARGDRRCNLDPGFLGSHNFILATHKGYTHRIYLGRGVYADLTLIYRHGSFRPLQWTYPDYASAPMIGLLNLLRGVYQWQLRKGPERDADDSEHDRIRAGGG